MASYSVTLFKNSGFNAVNIPDSPELLSQVGHFSCDALQILQQRFLTSVQVRANWNAVQDVDYAKIGDFYYMVDGIAMLSTETAQLSLTPDFLTSAGGVKNLQFTIMDGVTDRATTSSDRWGEFSEADPLTAPQQPLDVDTTWGSADGEGGSYTLLESTIDLARQSVGGEGITYTDESGATCTVPQTYSIGDKRTDYDLTPSDEVKGDNIGNATLVYDINDTGKPILNAGQTAVDAGQTTLQGVARARSLGIEGGIIDQWRVPKKFVGNTVKEYYLIPTEKTGEYMTDGHFQTISGSSGKCSTLAQLKPIYNTDIKNKRVFYGEYNKYGIITAGGNQGEFKPEEIGNGDIQPEISFRSDPRPDGAPYYRFSLINGNKEFWRNCLKGAPWQKVPFVYQGASGTELNTIRFNNEMSAQSVNYQYSDAELTRSATTQWQANQYAQLMNKNNLINIFGSGFAAIDSTASSHIGTDISATKGMFGMIGTGINLFGTSRAQGMTEAFLETQARDNQAMYQLQSNALYANYITARGNELSNLYQANTIYVPTVNFPYNSNIIRDIKGNGFMLYKYRYRNADQYRIDRLLTMYGYKETEDLTADSFHRRVHFDYVACNNVSVSGFARWFNDGIATQLKAGVRIWHELPNLTAYDENPIK